MVNVKIFTKNEKKNGYPDTKIYSQDIGSEFNIKKMCHDRNELWEKDK